MEAKRNTWEQYFEEILANISDKEFDALLAEVEPFSHIGPDVMHYMQYTEALVDANLYNNGVVFSCAKQSEWFDPNSNLLFAA